MGMLGRRREALEQAMDEIGRTNGDDEEEETDKPVDVSPIVADVSNPETVREAIEEWVDEHDGVHTLINNAGITRDGLLLRMDEDEWNDVLNTNLDGSFYCSKAVVRSMMRQRWGRIIMISSVIALIGNPGQTNYAASKAGMIGLAKSLARELGSRSITANVIAPGYVETEMTEDMTAQRREQLLEKTPLERLGSPEDIVELAKFLASDRADYITGELIRVDGGLAM